MDEVQSVIDESLEHDIIERIKREFDVKEVKQMETPEAHEVAISFI